MNTSLKYNKKKTFTKNFPGCQCSPPLDPITLICVRLEKLLSTDRRLAAAQTVTPSPGLIKRAWLDGCGDAGVQSRLRPLKMKEWSEVEGRESPMNALWTKGARSLSLSLSLPLSLCLSHTPSPPSFDKSDPMLPSLHNEQESHTMGVNYSSAGPTGRE